MSEPVFIVALLLAWLAGMRLYLTVFGIGLAAAMGWATLPPALEVCASPWVLGISGVLALVEFVTDKIPGVDSVSDLLQTVLRIPAGAFLAAAVLSPDGQLDAGPLLAGGTAALGGHLLKSGTRATLNLSPEPASNWAASLGEDGVVITALALAIANPWLALGIAVGVPLFAAGLLAWLLLRLVRRRRPAPG